MRFKSQSQRRAVFAKLHTPSQYQRHMEIKNFERMRLESEARAYSNLSLERPLTLDEFKKYKDVMKRLEYTS